MKLKTVSLLCTLMAAAGLAQASSLATLPVNTGFDVSGDGRYAVYGNSSGIFRYDIATGVATNLGGLAVASSGVAGRMRLSSDGSMVLGAIRDTSLNGNVAAVYGTSTGTWASVGSFGTVGPASNASTGWSMSSDGRYVVGASYHNVQTSSGSTVAASQAFIADRATGSFTNLSDDPSANVQSRINAVSTDGSVMVGYNTTSRLGAIWKRQADGSYQRSDIHVDGSTAPVGEAIAISDNGRWAAGQSGDAVSAQPYVVNIATGSVTGFAKLPNSIGGASIATPIAVSDDGQTIIGTHQVGTGALNTNLGFIWTAAGGVLNIDDYFASFGIDTANQYNFVSPQGMSDDAMTFTGIARNNLTGGLVGFVVTVTAAVPEPGSYALLAAGLGVLGLVARRRRPR